MSTRLQQRVVAKTADSQIYAHLDAPGTVFTNRGATGTVIFTLPPIPTSVPARVLGWWYEFEVHAAYAFRVAAAAGTICTQGNAAANSVGFEVASNEAGGRILAKCDGTQWICSGIGPGFCVNGSQITPTIADQTILTGLLATTTELNRAADVSTRLVAATGTLAVTVAAHDGKTVLLDTASGSVCTLPAATGTGARFRFVVSVKPTSNAHIVKVTTTDIMKGLALGTDDDAPPVGNVWPVAADTDTITLNGSTTGGYIGDVIECEDTLAATWSIRVQLQQTGTEATPFSATVS